MASGLAATFRILYSGDSSFERKLEAAEELVSALLLQHGWQTGEDAALPPLVRGHYLRSLLEWSCGVLTKKTDGAEGSGPGKKGKKGKAPQLQPAAEAAAGARTAQPAKLQPRCWAVLGAVLGSSSTTASQQLPAALLPAATASLQMLREGGPQQQQQQGELLGQLASLLQLLNSKFGGSFRPSLEHAVSAAEAALAGHAAAAGVQQDWQPAVAAAAQLLLAAAAAHPNQRKVWDTAVPRLLPLLAQAAFPATTHGSSNELTGCCRQLLESLVFHQQHVAALAAAAAAEMAAALAEACGSACAAAAPQAAEPDSEAAVEDGGPVASQQPPPPQRSGSYAAQLFATVRQGVAEGGLPLALLPWMVGGFCTALRQHRRAAQTEAAITGQAGRRAPAAQHAEEGTTAEEGAGATASQQQQQQQAGRGISVSADFHFWLALLRTLLPHVQQLQEQAAAAAKESAAASAALGEQLAQAASGLALLAGALRALQLYRPTQDPAAHQRLLLQRLADAALRLAQLQQGQQPGGVAGVVPAALGVLQGILAVEHRVIQEQLPLLWSLLLSAPSASGGGVAASVASSLVSAFAELRQLEVLLLSLTASLQQQQQPQVVVAEGPPAVAPADILGSSQFQAALALAVRQLPSGQVPSILRLAAEAAQQLSASGGGSGQAVTGLYCCCLASLRIDLTTAMAAAAAAGALVTALAPLLLPLLAAAAGLAGSGKQQSQKQRAQLALLPALLQLYRQALEVHARCAALHPEVAPLAGQYTQHPGDQQAPAGGHRAAGYFAPLTQQQGGATAEDAAPQLASLLQAAGSGGGGGLGFALLQAAEQRLQVLHQRRQYLVHTCLVTLLPAEEQGELPAQQQAAGKEQEAQQAQLESELQQLATALVAAAAGEASSSPADCSNSVGGGGGGSGSGALQLVAGALPQLQEWAAPQQLQALLQACLRQAVAGSGSGSSEHQLMCRQVLGGDLLEHHQLAVLLPAAAAAELSTALSAAFGAAAAAGEENGVAEEAAHGKRKKAKKGGAGAAAGSSQAAAALLRQLDRVAAGKAVKGSSWVAAVEGSCTAIASLAADVGSSSSSKKRKQPGASAAAAASSSLLAVQQQALLLAELPLGHLPAEASAGMVAVALGGLLCCCEGSLALLQAADAGQRQELASSTLSAMAGCLALLACMSGSLRSQQQQHLPGSLQAALTAAANTASLAGSSSQIAAQQQLAAAAEHSIRAMQSTCSVQLAALDASGLQQVGEQLGKKLAKQQEAGSPQQQWAAAVLAQACLAACCATADMSRSDNAASEAYCSAHGAGSRQQHPVAVAALVGSTAAVLEASVAGALPAVAAAAAAAAGGSWQQGLLAGSLYHSSALLLRLRCCEHPAADVLDQQLASSGARATCLTSMAANLQTAAGLLMQALPEGGLLEASLLEYLAACCSISGRMRPAASGSHYSSLLALLLHLLARQPAAAAPTPVRQTLPFAAAFPAAASQAGSGAAVRPLLLEALRELVAGSSSQQLLLPLRYVEAALPAAAPAGGGGGLALPLCELVLVLLEAGSGSRQQRLLGQHCERVACLLTGLIGGAAYRLPQQQQQEQQQQGQQELPSLQQLAAAILAAGEGSASSLAPAASAPPAGAASPALAAAELAMLCTAVRALESLAARPRLFPLPSAATSSILASVTALWTAYAERQPRQQAAAAAALPGFCFRLGSSDGAGLFAGCCNLLLAMLRHRQQDLRRCLPLLLQAVRALLRFLVAAELSAKLVQQLELPPGSLESEEEVEEGGRRQREQRWRVKCAELLAAVTAEVAGLKDAGIGRYCPQLLSDYLLLAAAPPSGRSKALLHYSSPAAAAAASAGAGAAGSTQAAAAAAAAAGPAVAVAATVAAGAEEDVLAGEPLSPEAAAALRRGAHALYGACSAAEIQFLYASLGSAGGGGAAAASWRAALAALKADYEKNYKYTGKV